MGVQNGVNFMLSSTAKRNASADRDNVFLLPEWLRQSPWRWLWSVYQFRYIEHAMKRLALAYRVCSTGLASPFGGAEFCLPFEPVRIPTGCPASRTSPDGQEAERRRPRQRDLDTLARYRTHSRRRCARTDSSIPPSGYGSEQNHQSNSHQFSRTAGQPGGL